MPVYLYPIFLAKIIALVIGCFYLQRLPVSFKLIVIHVIIALIAEVVGLYLNWIQYPNNSLLFNVYDLIELWLLGYVGMLFITTGFFKKIIPLLLILLTLYWLYNFVVDGPAKFYNWFLVIYSLFLILIYVVALFDNALFNKKDLLREPLFFLCLSIILYYSCSIPLFGILNYLIKSDMVMAARLFYITHAINIIRYTLVAIAFYLYARQAKRAYVQQ